MAQSKARLQVASIAAYCDGKILFGRRSDNGKWCLAGGKLNRGEAPEVGALRELREETGFIPTSMRKLGSRVVKNGRIEVHSFAAQVRGEPDASKDPDAEMAEFVWADPKSIPDRVINNLYNHPDVTLSLLNLLKPQEDTLSKGLKEKFLAVAAAGAMSTAAMAQNPSHNADHAYNEPHAAEWSPKGLAPDMHPIAHLESSFGKRLAHMPHSKGDYHSSFGAVGMKPVTAHETYKRSSALQKLYPGFGEEHAFIKEFKQNPAFYNTVASTHWNQLKKLANGDSSKAAFAWRWGSGRLARTAPELVSADPYVQAFQKLSTKSAPPAVAKSMFDTAMGEWLAKSKTPECYWKCIDGLRIPVVTSKERKEWDRRYEDMLKSSFEGKELSPIKVEVAKLSALNGVRNNQRLALYSRMAKSGDPLPPILIQRSGNGYNVIDGNHRLQAANDTGLTLLDAFEIKPPDEVGAPEGRYKLYDLATDEFNLFQPKMRQTGYGQVYEPVDLEEVKEQLKKLGYQGYRGASHDPHSFVYFDAAQPHNGADHA